jgi:PKHD-type hydroxylase
MLVTVDQILNQQALADARSQLERVNWESGLSTAGQQSAQAKRNWQVPESAPELPALRAMVMQALNQSALFFTAALPLKVLPPFFNRYEGQANTYGFHADCAMRRWPGAADGGSPMASAYVRADVSATLFLSDPDEYEGGELRIEDTFGTHDVKLPAGSLVLYPSSSIHAVMPVTKGRRLASFMFIQSMVRDAGQRRLLYDMDMALLQLREQVGESDAVVRLTGTYHNLLRQWGETA